MEFYEVVNKRRTVREFQPIPIEEEKIQRILEAGLKAPTNDHLREWEFILLKDPENRRKALVDGLKARDLTDEKALEKYTQHMEDETQREMYLEVLPMQLTMMLEAPELLIVCYRMKKKLNEIRSYNQLNCLASVWMCIENVVLAMAAEGLFGCTYAPYDTTGLKQYLEIPDDYEVAVLLPFGYPKPYSVKQNPVSLHDKLHIDKW